MKKLLSILLIFVCVLFSACSSKTSASAETKTDQVSTILDSIDGFSTLDDETLKALAVIIRTKQISLGDIDNTNNQKNSSPSERAEYISSITDGEVLDDFGLESTNLDYGYFESKTWKRKLDKADILIGLNKLNISLSSLKNITPNFEQKKLNATDEKTTKVLASLTADSKTIDAEKLSEIFELESSLITDFSYDYKVITIFGKTQKPSGYFDITESVLLSKQGMNYEQLLKHFYSKNA